MRSRSCLAGMEVPITGSDSVKFVQLSVPSSTSTSVSSPIIGKPPVYFTWKICRSRPNVLEIMEFCGHKQFPKTGLQIVFPEALFPFAVICKIEMTFSSIKSHSLHAMTVSGVAYLIKLENISNYVSSSNLQSDDFVDFNTLTHPHQGAATAVAGIAELMVVGRSDGSVECFQLGILDQRAPDFVQEPRDDSGLGRFWGVLSSMWISLQTQPKRNETNPAVDYIFLDNIFCLMHSGNTHHYPLYDFPNTIVGAMVVGRDKHDGFYDVRSNYNYTEPTLAGNAGLVAALVALSGERDIGIDKNTLFSSVPSMFPTPPPPPAPWKP